MAALLVDCRTRVWMRRPQLLIANPRERLVLIPVLGRIRNSQCHRHSHGRRVLPTASFTRAVSLCILLAASAAKPRAWSGAAAAGPKPKLWEHLDGFDYTTNAENAGSRRATLSYVDTWHGLKL